jgi:hypothetical protein
MMFIFVLGNWNLDFFRGTASLYCIMPIYFFSLVRHHQIVLSLAAQENHSQEVFWAYCSSQSKSKDHQESDEEQEDLVAGSGSINGGRSGKWARSMGAMSRSREHERGSGAGIMIHD